MTMLALVSGVLLGLVGARVEAGGMSSYERGALMSSCYQAQEISFITPCLSNIQSLP